MVGVEERRRSERVRVTLRAEIQGGPIPRMVLNIAPGGAKIGVRFL